MGVVDNDGIATLRQKAHWIATTGANVTRSFDLREPFGDRVSRDPIQQAALVARLVEAMRTGNEAAAAALLHDLTARSSDPAARTRLADECRRLAKLPRSPKKEQAKAPNASKSDDRRIP